MEVVVLDRHRRDRLSARTLAAFLARLAAEMPHASRDRMGVSLVGDAAMRRYNRVYRGKDCTTDVLAFPAARGLDPESRRHLGDLVISIPRARAQARQRGHSLSREVRTLALHGYLHLLGYDHERDDGTMRRLERRLTRAFLARPAARSTR